MKERNFQTLLVKALRDSGAIVFNIHGHAMQVAGIPDLYVAHTIWIGWLELKTGTNKITILQSRALKQLEDRGVDAVIILARKPKIIVKMSDETIIGVIPFMSNNIDGIEFLKRLSYIIKMAGEHYNYGGKS